MPRKRGLLANLRSCVFNTSLAIFAEETTRVGLEPKRNDMSGPWRFESCHRLGSGVGMICQVGVGFQSGEDFQDQVEEMLFFLHSVFSVCG